MAKSSSNFEDMKYALTFDDILLVPQYSEIVPTEISPKAEFARGRVLHTPIISAAMDTVTENKMARVMAQQGGLGVIHKNMTVEQQAFEAEKVKKYESGMIKEPITLEPHRKVKDALELMRKYSISGVPITVGGKLVGILTNRDLRFETNIEQKIEDVMTKDKLVTAEVGTTLQQAKQILQKHRIEKLPIVDKSGLLRGLITIKDIEKAKSFPNATKDEQGRLMVAAAVGIDQTSRDRVVALAAAGADVVVIDTAHGHSKNVLAMVEWVSQNYKDLIVVAGNVVTADATEALIKKGAEVVKVGVGPGSICTTRIVAGVGMPQISAVIECAEAARKLG
ncbi:MAG: IMP dehydrogenase, partial [Bdellovibrionota bacterium]